MKKKFRNITVNNQQYAWMVKNDTIIIWKDKKEIITKDVMHFIVTPKVVEELITDYLHCQTLRELHENR